MAHRRVAQPSDNKRRGGAPSFAHFAKGGSWNIHTMGRTHVLSTVPCPAPSTPLRAGSCKECKDGAPTVVLVQRKPKSGHALGSVGVLRLRRTIRFANRSAPLRMTA